MYMTIKKGYAFRYERKKGIMWAPTEQIYGRRRRQAMCATMKFPRVRQVAKDLKIKLQTKRDGERDKPQLCDMIKRKVGINRTPINVQIRKSVQKFWAPLKAAEKAAAKKAAARKAAFKKKAAAKKAAAKKAAARKAALKKKAAAKKAAARKAALKKKAAAKKAAPKKKAAAKKAAPKKKAVARKAAPKKKVVARKAAPKKPINLTTMFPSSTKKPAPVQKPSVSNSDSNSNDNSSNFRIVYKQAPVSPKPPIKRQRPQEVRRGGGANAASINAAMNKIKRGQALTPEENMKLQENVRRTQRARWSSVVNRHSNSAGAPDPLSNEEFRKLRSKYTEGRATKVAKTGNLRAAGKVYTFR